MILMKLQMLICCPSSIAHNGNNGDFTQQQPFLVAVASAPVTSRRSRAKDICYNCGLYGHWAKDCKKKNKSALDHTDCVEKAVQELIGASLIKEVSNRPHVVDPLTVSIIHQIYITTGYCVLLWCYCVYTLDCLF